MEYFRDFALALTFLAFAVAVELAFPRTRYTMRQRLRGLSFIVAMTAAHGIIAILLSGVWRSTGLMPAKVPVELAWAWPFEIVLGTLVALLVLDFFGYWYHRLQHTLLWPFHAVHHSVEELHAANNYGHAFDEAFRFIFTVLPLSLIPLLWPAHQLSIVVYVSFTIYYIHSPVTVNFGRARYVLTDNVYHRIHHSTDPAHFNRNFGTTFTVWDQLFGTAYFPAKNEWPDTGLADVREPTSFREWLSLPLRVMRLRNVPGDLESQVERNMVVVPAAGEYGRIDIPARLVD